ncbi:MAG: hypothetical protein HY675_11850 [Chloroflexi bacterium]|nr:hypothetical protein [Chloroflexota bacterium]
MNGDEELIRQVVLSTVCKCGTCGRQYDLENVSILGHEEELWFLMVVCNRCNSRGLVAALVKEQKQPAIVTDLNEEELERFKRASTVKPEDVDEMRRFLEQFDGDFASLFSKR